MQDKVLPAHAPGRFKQWLNLLQRNFPHAETLFQEIRPMRRPPEINAVLMRHGIVAEPTALAA